MDQQDPQELTATCPLWAEARTDRPDVLGLLVDPYFVVRVDSETLRDATGEARRFDASLTLAEIVELAVPSDGAEHLLRLDLRDRSGPLSNGRVGYIPKNGSLRIPPRQVVSPAPAPAPEPVPALDLPGGEAVAVRAFASVDAAVGQVVAIAETYREDAAAKEAAMLSMVEKLGAQAGETQRELIKAQAQLAEARIELARASATPAQMPASLGDHIAGIVTTVQPIVEMGSGLLEMAGGWDGLQEKMGTLTAGVAAKQGLGAFAGLGETAKDLLAVWAASKMGIGEELDESPADVTPPSSGETARDLAEGS